MAGTSTYKQIDGGGALMMCLDDSSLSYHSGSSLVPPSTTVPSSRTSPAASQMLSTTYSTTSCKPSLSEGRGGSMQEDRQGKFKALFGTRGQQSPCDLRQLHQAGSLTKMASKNEKSTSFTAQPKLFRITRVLRKQLIPTTSTDEEKNSVNSVGIVVKDSNLYPLEKYRRCQGNQGGDNDQKCLSSSRIGTQGQAEKDDSKYNQDQKQKGQKRKQVQRGSSEQLKSLKRDTKEHEAVEAAFLGSGEQKCAKRPAGKMNKFGAICGACGVVAVTNTGWRAHQTAHRLKYAVCKYCPYVFLTVHGRNLHQEHHREGQASQVDNYCECGICKGSFINIMYLELHLLELHGPSSLHNSKSFILGPTPDDSEPAYSFAAGCERQLFRCGVCNAKFTFSFNLDCHMALHPQMSYACGICDSVYFSLDLLVSHCRSHMSSLQPAPSVPTPCTILPTPTRYQTKILPQCRVWQSPLITNVGMWGNNQGIFHHSSASPETDPVTTTGMFSTISPVLSSPTPPSHTTTSSATVQPLAHL